MSKKMVSPTDKMKGCRDGITDSINRWKNTNENGCNDPAWADGVNMNLLRNHVLYYKHQIMELSEENGLPLPPEYFLPTPPEVDNGYMANLNQEDRVKRLMQYGTRITTDKKIFDDRQLSFV